MIEPTREEMIATTKQHLDFCQKELASKQFRVAGVPILSSFTYELVQMMNHEWIKSRIPAEEPTKEPTKERA